jgi:hypothetical protein
MELRKDLPVKYQLGLHRLHPEYPQVRDIIFDLSTFIFKSRKTKKRWTVEDMVISSSAIKDVFVDMTDENQKQQIKDTLIQLNNEQHILIAEGQLHITESGLKMLFNF